MEGEPFPVLALKAGAGGEPAEEEALPCTCCPREAPPVPVLYVGVTVVPWRTGFCGSRVWGPAWGPKIPFLS